MIPFNRAWKTTKDHSDTNETKMCGFQQRTSFNVFDILQEEPNPRVKHLDGVLLAHEMLDD